MTPSASLLLVTAGLVGCVLAGPLLAVHLWLRNRPWADERWRIGLPLATLGLLAYLSCLVFYVSPTVGRLVVTLAVAGAWAWVGRELIQRRDLDAGQGLILPLGGMAALGLCYLALLYLPQLGESYVMQAAARFVHPLPPDPELPELLGRRLYLGESLRLFAGDWLSSDRPPLQAGFYLLALPWINFAGVPTGLGYECVGVFAQLLWVPAVWLLATSLGQTRRAAMVTVAVVGSVGIIMLNTVYVWPKLLGAAYTLCAGLLLLDDERPRPRALLILAVILSALGWLAHGSVAFSVGGLVPWWILQRCPYWRQVPLLLGVFAAVALPWLCYQHLIDPPGNRLLKWHLAGVIPIDSRSFGDTLLDAYQAQTWDQWIAGRWANARFTFSGSFSAVFDVFTTAAKPRRQEEFFFLWRAFGVLNLAWALGPLAAAIRRRWSPSSRLAAMLAGWTLSTVLLWVIAMFAPASTLLHQGSYVVLLATSGVAAVLLLRIPRWLGWPILAWHFFYFAMTWLPYFGSHRLNLDMFVVGVLGLLGLAALFACARALDRGFGRGYFSRSGPKTER